MKRRSTGKSLTLIGLAKALVLMLVIILIFTFVDYLAHTISPDFSVPSWYFRNKIIYGTIIAFIAYIFVRNKPIFQKSLILSAVVSILLQIRYFLLGYPPSFVLLFLFIHFAVLFVVSWLAFKTTD